MNTYRPSSKAAFENLKACIRVVPPILLVLMLSCEDLVEIEAPRTEITRNSIFEDEGTANAAIAAIYYQMVSGNLASGGISSVTFLTGLSSDELLNYSAGSGNPEYDQFNNNELISTNKLVERLWSEAYQYVYKANAIIEGLKYASNLSDGLRDQLMGEAKFIRAFAHFYLVNLFGDIPLVLTTDYRLNAQIERKPRDSVYQQIIQDLNDAKALMVTDYSNSNNEKTRPNHWCASALLSRVYLYDSQWENAEQEASHVISSTLFSIEPELNEVFLKNSDEAIWQLMPRPGSNTLEANTFIFLGYPKQAALRTSFLAKFEPNDRRLISWVGTATYGSTSYYFPYKYKEPGGSDPTIEYYMVLRLAEQYLIRAEARINLDMNSGGLEDLNVIRYRSGLDNFESNDKAEILNAIQRERRSEFFIEWGHRWFDLKRTNTADDVLSGLKPNWNVTDALYPIPQIQMLSDPGMSHAQNPGY